jgi:3-deoxy-D-arabino-heptulosonate 7-phosphate (DAHP) synthase
MIEVKDISQINKRRLTNNDSLRALSSKRKYLVLHKDKMHLVDDYIPTIKKYYANHYPDEIEVYKLNEF